MHGNRVYGGHEPRGVGFAHHPQLSEREENGRVLEQELTSSSRSSSRYSLSHSSRVQENNNEGRKEGKAAANGAADILTDDGWVLSPIGDIGCSLFFAPCCNFQHGVEVAR